MTGPCSGSGTGVAKSGFASLQYIGPGAIGGALAGLSGWQGALVGASIGSLTFDLTTFCPSGPPAMPTFTAADIVALLAPIPTAARATAALKFQDFLGNIFWPLLCDCSVGTTSTLGAPSAYPSGAPATDPPPPAVAPCATNTSGPFVYTSGQTNLMNYVGTNLAVLGATSVRVTLDTSVFSAPGGSVTFTITQETPVSTVVRTDVVVEGATAHDVFSLPIFPGAEMIRVQSHANTWSGSVSVTRKIELFCGAVPGAVQVPCCPPDLATQAMLEQLLGMVTLIQRQAAPFSYVYGANHAGLTGHGSFAVSGLLGVSVDVTTLPAQYGVAVGSPEEHFGLGYVNLGTADGWTSSRAIDHDGSLFIPVSGGLYTAVGYSLAPGVEVAVRELVREP